MSKAVDLERTDDVAKGSSGIVTLNGVAKIPTRGHYHGSLTALFKTAGASANGQLSVMGTNNPDPSDTNGESLAQTTARATEGQDDISWSNKGYKYVFVLIDDLTDIELDELRLFLTGYPGSA